MMSTPQPLFRSGVPGLIPDAWIIEPRHVTSAPPDPPVVVVHGIRRQVEEMAGLLRIRAEETGRTLVLPRFDTVHWRRYQRALCPRRSDLALLSLLRALRNEKRIASGPVELAGFSGGAQFAHRFAWFYPDRVGRLCLAAPGWWTFPDAALTWPYGTGAGDRRDGLETLALRANLPRFLDREIAVLVGDRDTRRDHNLRAGPAIDAQQGRTRVDRARAWCAAMGRAGRAVGVPAATPSFDTLSGCGHSFSECVTRAGLDRHFVRPARRTDQVAHRGGPARRPRLPVPSRRAA